MARHEGGLGAWVRNPALHVRTLFWFVLILLWCLMVLVSINHLVPFCPFLQIPASTAGYLAWSAFVVAIGALGHKFWKELSLVFFFYFCLGWGVGPFLEPPGDPLDHLSRTYSICGKTSVDIPKTNQGLWQYSMLGNMLCHEPYSLPPQDILNRIDLANGVFWAFGAAILFVVGLRAGLSVPWAFFSVCFAFLFMGTNRFSYFSYYSFAAGFSSMWIYWLWIAAFFFKPQGRLLLPGILAAGALIPVLLVNHVQEALFLSLICGVWILYFLLRFTALSCSGYGPLWRQAGWWLFLASLVAVFFILPQWPVFQAGLRSLFVGDNWQAHQKTVLSWHGLHLIGKIWTYRVHDTLGFFGFLPALLTPLFFLPGVIRQERGDKWLILLLGLVPFGVYCTPLLNYVWTSNCTLPDVYYRMCYSSLFWLPLALVLSHLAPYRLFSCFFHKKITCERHLSRSSGLGLHFQQWLPCHTVQSQKRVNGVFFCFCFLGSVLLSCIQSGPIYGKLDFITVDSKKWWAAWQPMIEKVMVWKKEEIETDYITGYVLQSIFNVPLKHKQLDLLAVNRIPKRNIESMVKGSNEDRTGCLINLHRFQPTWIPRVTNHWSPQLSDPGFLYQVEQKKSGGVVKFLQEEPVGKCYVFF